MFEKTNQSNRVRLLIISKDIIDINMGGSGMRNYEIARALSPEFDVTLAIPNPTHLEIPGVKLIQYKTGEFRIVQNQSAQSDVILLSGDLFEQFQFLQDIEARLVVDLYNPFLLENLFYYLNDPLSIQESFFLTSLEINNRLLILGDFFICGSEHQRDFWLGQLTALGRVNPRNFSVSSDLRALIDVVGIGFPQRQPIPDPKFRENHSNIPEKAKIVLWGGGVWEWLDPLTLIYAWPDVLSKHPDAYLVFLGTQHPNKDIPAHSMAERAMVLAEKIGEKDASIIFIPWVPYETREAYLCEADLSVILHEPHIETRYSIRTRVFDCFWAKLPVLVSEGDITSQWVRQYDVGRVLPPRDVRAISQAINDMLDIPKQEWNPNFEVLRDIFTWESVVEPLKRYCIEGKPAPDRDQRNKLLDQNPRKIKLHNSYKRAYYFWQKEGVVSLLNRSWKYIRKNL